MKIVNSKLRVKKIPYLYNGPLLAGQFWARSGLKKVKINLLNRVLESIYQHAPPKLCSIATRQGEKVN